MEAQALSAMDSLDRNIQLDILIPVYNEAKIICDTVQQFSDKLIELGLGNSRLILLENGSTDDSRSIVMNLAKPQSQTSINICTESCELAGLGDAYSKGIKLALDSATEQAWIMLTAADLPFGFTDLINFLAKFQNSEKPLIYVGSKYHSDSKVVRGAKRYLAGLIFRVLRTLILGMKTKDPQGIIFLNKAAVLSLAPMVVAKDYFYTTELIYYAEKHDIPVYELPVVFAGEKRKSSVNIFRDGSRMIFQMIKLLINSGRL